MPPRNPSWFWPETILKGVILGLVGTLAAGAPSTRALGLALALTFGMVLLAILGTMRQQRGAGPVPLAARLLLALLDRPLAMTIAVAAGLILGMVAANWSTTVVGVGAVAGFLLGLALLGLERLPTGRAKLVIGSLGLALAALALWRWSELIAPYLTSPPDARGLALLVGAGIVYFSIFVSRAEESEFDVALIGAVLATALAQFPLPPTMRGLGVLIPAGVYIVYCERIRKGLVAFKHVVRGLTHERERNIPQALWSYQRALAIQPRYELARAGQWRVHARLDPAELARDPAIAALIDPALCLDRARKLLERTPIPAERGDEIGRILDLILAKRPDCPLLVGHERVRLALATNGPDEAIALVREMARLLPRHVVELPDHELEALYRTWRLALTDPVLLAAGGAGLVESGPERLSFLAVLTRRRRQAPADTDAAAFATMLYPRTRRDDLIRHAELDPDDELAWFDFSLCRDLARMERDVGNVAAQLKLLRLAEFGLPHQRLAIGAEIADLLDQTDPAEADAWRRKVREMGSGRNRGELADAERAAFYRVVKALADRAREAGDHAGAIENYSLYVEAPESGLATLEVLRELHEARGDKARAIKQVEQGLLYQLEDGARRQWLAHKERLYASVTAEEIQPLAAEAATYLDFNYCLERARGLFDRRADPGWVAHYIDLAAIGGGQWLIPVNFLLGRLHLREEKWEEAAACFEAVVAAQPARFDNTEQEGACFGARIRLADLYLDRLDRPAKAAEHLLVYKDYLKSGADTLYKLGLAYERAGELARAAKWYDMVLVYPSHPKADAARGALARLGKAAPM